MTKHIGRVKSSGQRMALLFREVPDDTEFCLLVEYDRLPEGYKQNMLTILNSDVAQAKEELYQALEGMGFGDGLPILETLHKKGFINKVKIDDVILTPTPQQQLSLRELNSYLAKNAPQPVEQYDSIIEPSKVQEAILRSPEPQTKVEMAKGLMEKARSLEKQAKELKEQAYVLNSKLRPSAGRPALNKDERTKRREARNRARRERYAQEKAATEG